MLTNKFNLPLPLQVWLVNDEYDHVSDANYISATSLLKPVRQTILSGRVQNQEIDISDLTATVTGTAIHDSIESAWINNARTNLKKLGFNTEFRNRVLVNPKPEDLKEDTIPVYIEQRSIKEFNGFKIGGKFDFVINGKLHDIKTTSVYTYINDSSARDYTLQGSIYKWLNPDIIKEDNLTINYVFTDWSAASAKANPSYPQSRCASKDYPLLPKEEIESYITSKLEIIKENFSKEESDIIECPDEELWRSDTVYKYYADPTKLIRATKNFSSYEDAQAYLLSKAGKGIIKTVLGTPKRCQYCPAFAICSQRRKYYD